MVGSWLTGWRTIHKEIRVDVVFGDVILLLLSLLTDISLGAPYGTCLRTYAIMQGIGQLACLTAFCFIMSFVSFWLNVNPFTWRFVGF